MGSRLAFNKRDRHRMTQDGFGFRPRNDWGGGDLPAPWAEGDIVELTDFPNERIDQPYETFYVVTYVCSIDEGDAWYCRVGYPNGMIGRSDRLHIAYADRSTWDEDVDWMSCFTLVDTADPDGLSERQRLLAAGWSFEDRWETCPTCGNTERRDNPRG